MVAALTDALSNWSTYISGTGTLVVKLDVAPLGAPTTAGLFTLGEGGPTASTYVGQSGGRTVFQSSAATELQTGTHAASSDITITLNSQLLPTISSEASYDLVTVFEHELMHGFGMTGFRTSGGALGTSESTFDSLSVLGATGSDSFVGGAAESVYGGPVPLTTQLAGSDYYHLGATGTAADPAILYNDIMDPVSGPGRTISALDVAILDDLGIPLTQAGYELFDPAPSLTAQSLSAAGTPVTDPQISGTTLPGDQVTLSENGVVLGTTIANAAGAWAIDPTSLADGTHVLLASVPYGSQTVTYGVGIVLDATTPVATLYPQVLGRAADPAGLATFRQQLVDGQSVATVRATLAQSVESEMDGGRIYAAVLGRWIDQGALVGLVNELSNGETQAGFRTLTADSVESETDIGQIYAASLGRWVDQASLVGLVGNLAAGGTQSAIRAEVAASPEAGAAITSLYSTVLGRAASAADVAGWQGAFAAGSSLGVLRADLGGSAEAATAINAIYANILGRAGTSADITGWQGSLSAGSALATTRSTVAGSTESSNDINAFAQSALGHALDAGSISTYQQLEANGASLATVKLDIAESAESVADINAGFAMQPAVAPPNAVELAGDESEIVAGVTQATIQAQISQLSGGATPRQADLQLAAPITPVTVGAAPASFIYGLLSNDALQAAQPDSVLVTYAGAGGEAIVTGFNPAADVIQVRSQEAASFTAVQNDMFYNGSTIISLHGGAAIDLANVAPSQLTAHNFRFV